VELSNGYKRTEVGANPVGWQAVLAREIGSISGGNGFPLASQGKSSGDYPFFKVSDMNNEGNEIFMTAANHYISEQTRKRLGATTFPAGAIVFAKVGAAIFLERKKILGQRSCIDNNMAAFVLDESRADVRFVHSVLLSKKLGDLVATTALPALNGKQFGGLTLPLPPLTEQRAISEALSDVDALLTGLERLIDKKRDIKQAAMQQLLTGQTRLPGFQGEWEAKSVQDVVGSYFCGPSPTCDERNIQGDVEWGVLKTTAATKENGWDWTKHKALPPMYWNKPALELKVGDVIVTKAGPRHRVGVPAWVNYVPPRIIPSGKMIALRPKPEKVVPLMLAAAISARESQTFLDQRTTGMAESQVNFENSVLLDTPIRVPTIEEQTAIATVLSDMDAELAALETRRDKTRALKQGMMQELLTGKTRLVKPEAAHV
jgi:type I restriction enzyme S subunit